MAVSHIVQTLHHNCTDFILFLFLSLYCSRNHQDQFFISGRKKQTCEQETGKLWQRETKMMPTKAEPGRGAEKVRKQLDWHMCT